VEAFEAVDAGREARRAAAQDGYARGDACDLLSSAHGLPVAVSAARPVSSTLDVYTIFRPFQCAAADGSASGKSFLWRCPKRSTATPARPPQSSIAVAESGGKRGATSGSEKDTVGYDAGKTAKGRKEHALADVEGLPLRVIVHSAGTQDRDGAALVLDKIRKHGSNSSGADAGYHAHQGKDAVARSPGLRLEIVKRTDDTKGFLVLPTDGQSSEPSHGSATTAVSSRTMKTSPTPSPPFVILAAILFAIIRLPRI
jgi:hypothetical protein